MKKNLLKGNMKEMSMLIALVIIIVLFSILTNGILLRPMNIANLINQNAYVVILACGMLLCILTGGNIDLSVGSTVARVGACAGTFIITWHWNSYLSIFLCLLIGLLLGMWQGFWIAYVGIPPFICTLAGMFLFRGLARVVLDSRTISVMNDKFNNLFTSYIQISGFDEKGNCKSAIIVGAVVAALLLVYTFISITKKKKQGIAQSTTGSLVKMIIIDVLIILYSIKLSQYKGIPVMLIWILVVVLIFAFFTSSTVFGRYFYAVGGNEKATKLSGIDPRKVYFWAYFLMSFLAGFSGLLVASRIGSVDGNMGNSYEMDAIASCFIGGASAYGGSGTVPGIMIGAILLGVINQGMSIYGLPDQWQYVVKGAVLLVAVVFDVVSNHKTGKS